METHTEVNGQINIFSIKILEGDDPEFQPIYPTPELLELEQKANEVF
jgi:hypothetical protein